jgi:hypothetical protein
MSAVDAQDDTRTRWVLHHFRFDPERRERCNVVIGAWDTEQEFDDESHRLAELLRRRRDAGRGDPRESSFGTGFAPGELTAVRRSRVLAEDRRVLVASLKVFPSATARSSG